MALTESQLQSIITQLVTIKSTKGGIRMVKFDNREIRYGSDEEITEDLQKYLGMLAKAQGTRPRVMQHNLSEF